MAHLQSQRSSKPDVKADVRIEFDDEAMRLGDVARAGLWTLVLGIEVANALLLGLFATSYFQHDKRDSLLWVIKVFFLFSDAQMFLMYNSIWIALGYASLSGVFGMLAARHLWASLVSRELRFSLPSSRWLDVSKHSTSLRSMVHTPSRWILQTSQRLRRIRNAIGVYGPYFEVRLLVDEIIELVSQTIAAHSASRSLSNPNLNITFGLVIFVNSVSSGLFRRIFRDRIVQQRIASLATDLVLDFVWGSVLPVWMFMPLYDNYKRQQQTSVPISYTENSAREVERVFILSWGSYLLSIVPFCNSLLSVYEIDEYLRDVASASTRRRRASSIAAITPVAPTKHHFAAWNEAEVSADPNTCAPIPSARQRQHLRRRGWAMQLSHGLITVYGLVILVVSLRANGLLGAKEKVLQFACFHRVNPWFSTKDACIGRCINCTALGISGTKHEIAAALTYFDEESLSDLFLVECEALELPTELVRFSELQTLVLQSSTLVEWDRTVALTNRAFPDLRTIKIENVDLACEPTGLVVEPLSSAVEWLHIHAINSTAFLDHVGSNWQEVLYFDLEASAVTAFPRVVETMRTLLMLSLLDNDVEAIPDDWLALDELELLVVWLNGNKRLEHLPDALWRQSATSDTFDLQSSNLSVLPSWLPDVAKRSFLLYASGTPLCAAVDSLELSLREFVSCDSE